MSNWGLVQRYPLVEFGDEWANCYIEMKAIPYKKIQRYIGLNEEKIKANPEEYRKEDAELFNLIRSNFTAGRIFNGKEVVDMKLEDMDDIPTAIYSGLLDFLLENSVKEKDKQ